ncbi:hypothetical protein [Burkholderia stabilis]|uniref:hypothetical protein n=1 Tax=Burkholderia stabilis TaxID=95485 RepID=UPI00158D63B4|nr:hypothetical protein [Burkholderia stabilis]
MHWAAEFAPRTAEYKKYSTLEQEGTGYTAEQEQLKSYSGTSFSASDYGGMVKQTPGGSMFQYSSHDVWTDQRTSQSATSSQRAGSIDYVTVQGGAGLGGSVTINLYNGNVYVAGSISASREKGAGIVFGIIPDNVGKSATNRADATDQLLAGPSFGGNGCLYGVCGGLNHAVGGQTAFEVGVGMGCVKKQANPSGNGAGAYGVPVFVIPWMGD